MTGSPLSTASSTSKVRPLDEAVREHVAPGMHLHFASTPSRANAAIRAVCRVFRDRSPGFTLSSTGFHSTAHLLGRLRLGERYLASFYGDNYPTPRSNPLYRRLLAEGVALEHWSALSYTIALRAGALGHPYGVTTSVLGSTLEDELAGDGRFTVVADPNDPERRIGLVAAVRPDLTFVHVPAADAQGRVLAALPHSEGIWGALAARSGIVVTAERIVDEEQTARAPDAVMLPPHRVVAVCPAPFGAHPQPLFAPRGLDLPSYPDDFDAYRLLREVGVDDVGQAALVDEVLLRDDDGEAYAKHFDLAERAPNMASRQVHEPGRDSRAVEPTGSERLTVLAARRIQQLVRAKGYPVILAGVGHSFFAARMAKLWLAQEGIDVEVNVETGMYGIDCGPVSGPFILGLDVLSHARRLTSIEDVLGAVTCGADNRCLGVIGAAQVDARGNLNSTRLDDGTLLVGSGGANDIASAAAEVMVLASCDASRLVSAVPYITSPGRGVRQVVTEQGVLCRDADSPQWRIEDAFAPPAGTPNAGVERLRQVCPWPLSAQVPAAAAPLTPEERQQLASLQNHPTPGST
ncbi:CoA-transferase [Pseudonocardia sp. GCM10023141]|uniref:CoA-transferase n=1 Tax=Pseudonocardia sp. GCM10023141 TaxID=3252653 RepID=UPI003623E3A3